MLTTVQEILKIGGLDEPSDYTLLRLSSEAELVARAAEEGAVAAAFISKILPTVYPPTAANDILLLSRAEAFLALAQLVEPAKARKVYGSHYPIDSEDSPRYEALIDTEWSLQADKILNLYGADQTGGRAICLPGLVAGGELATGLLTPDERQQRLLDEVHGFLSLPLVAQ